MANLMPTDWRKTLDKLRDDVTHAVERWLPEREGSEPLGEGTGWCSPFAKSGGPRVDVEEREDEIRVTAELPGLRKKDFTVEIIGNRLMLRGEKKPAHGDGESEDQQGVYLLSECGYGPFARAITLPCEVDTEQAEGQYRNGVLRLRLPKPEQARTKRVHVDVKD